MTTVKTLWNWLMSHEITSETYRETIRMGKVSVEGAKTILIEKPENAIGNYPRLDFRYAENSQLLAIPMVI